VLDASSAQIYQYLNFDKLDEYKTEALLPWSRPDRAELPL
jgi:hypothetical protein